jgi:hypothetical protein
MLFSWFDAKAAKEFGAAMAQFFIERMPLSAGMTEKQFASKAKFVLEKMNTQVLNFKQQNKLNTYKTAQMGNTFKWALKDAGYDEAYVDQLTTWFIAKFQ